MGGAELAPLRCPARTPRRASGLAKGDGIETLLHYPIPPHLSGAYADTGWGNGAFPVAEAFSKTCLSLPMGPHTTDAQAERVIGSLKAYFASRTSSKKQRPQVGNR